MANVGPGEAGRGGVKQNKTEGLSGPTGLLFSGNDFCCYWSFLPVLSKGNGPQLDR